MVMTIIVRLENYLERYRFTGNNVSGDGWDSQLSVNLGFLETFYHGN